MAQHSQSYAEIKSWFRQIQLEEALLSSPEREERFPSRTQGRDISDILEDLMPEGILPGT
jgi:hypothetical protein